MTHINTEALSDADPIDAKAFADFKAWWKETSQHKAPELKHIARKAALAGWIAALSRRSASNTGGDAAEVVRDLADLVAGDTVDEFQATAILKAKVILSSLAAEAEPVAWRWREPPALGWHFYLKDGKDDTGPMPHAGRIIQPLYTRISSVSAEVTVTDEMVERAAKAMRALWRQTQPNYWDVIARAALNAALASINGGRENG